MRPDTVPVSGVPRLTIGAVLRLLRPDFPDLTISKLRFLEGEGLVTPARTRSGYRSYSDRDVERIRFVLTAQRDRFWPLKVIRAALEDEHGSAAQARTDVPTPTEQHGHRAATRLTAAELGRSPEVDASSVQAMVSFGLIGPDTEGRFDERDLEVARLASVMVRHGIEIRHLRALRTSADRQAELIRYAVAPLTSDTRTEGDPDRSPERVQEDLLRCSLRLHEMLLRRGLEVTERRSRR